MKVTNWFNVQCEVEILLSTAQVQITAQQGRSKSKFLNFIDSMCRRDMSILFGPVEFDWQKISTGNISVLDNPLCSLIRQDIKCKTKKMWEISSFKSNFIFLSNLFEFLFSSRKITIQQIDFSLSSFRKWNGIKIKTCSTSSENSSKSNFADR